MPKLTSIASSAVMALKMFMTLFSFYVGGVAAGGLHGSFSSNSPIRELARGAFLASWPVTNVPVWIWSAQYSNAWITMTKRFRTWKYCHDGCKNWKSKISCTCTKGFKVPFFAGAWGHPRRVPDDVEQGRCRRLRQATALRDCQVLRDLLSSLNTTVHCSVITLALNKQPT